MSRTITITVENDNYFKVQEGDKYIDGLCWDELLAQVATLTHKEFKHPRFAMHTKKEHEAIERAHQERLGRTDSIFDL